MAGQTPNFPRVFLLRPTQADNVQSGDMWIDGASVWLWTGQLFELVFHGTVLPANISLTSGTMLVGNSSGIGAGVAMSGHATMTNTGAVTIANGVITASMFARYALDALLLGIGKLGTARLG